MDERFRPEIPNFISESESITVRKINALMQECWNSEPMFRPTMDIVLQRIKECIDIEQNTNGKYIPFK